MIETSRADIFLSGAEALVNPVNCVGVMGKGLALEFKRRFPENFRAYAAACRAGTLRTGSVLPFFEGCAWIINFPTKDHWRKPSRIEFVEAGMAPLKDFLLRAKIASVAIPALGCGCGRLRLEDVSGVIIKAFADFPVRATLCLPMPR